MIDLDPIKQRLANASPGPWEWWTSNSFRRLSGPDGEDGGVMHATVARDGQPDISIREGDMAFIEHARTDIEDLLREVEYLRMKIADFAAQF